MSFLDERGSIHDAAIAKHPASRVLVKSRLNPEGLGPSKVKGERQLYTLMYVTTDIIQLAVTLT